MRKHCNYKKDIGYTALDEKQRCPKCNKTLRPDIVFFNEKAPMYAKLYQSLKSCEILVVIGTSGLVIDTSILVRAKMKKTILNNLEKSQYIDEELFSKVLYMPATEAIDEISKEIELFLNQS